MNIISKISGWGNYPKTEAKLLKPSSNTLLRSNVQKAKSFISRGMARSYGDSSISSEVIKTTYLDHFLEFDTIKGLLTAEAGITLQEILKVVVPKGWFLPVTPGSSYVTLGGAIASDVHGKNHHITGTFGQYIKSMNVMLGSGDILSISSSESADLFSATCGGMGLTGVIVSATVQLIPIKSSLISQKTIKAKSIEETIEAFNENSSSTYSVAWLDCFAKGKSQGRSILMLGEHEDSGGLELGIKNLITIPFYASSSLLNPMTIKIFNIAYWNKAQHNQKKIVPLMPYFYPLDAIGSWNKLYGKAGFLQYQCVIPQENCITNLKILLAEIAQSGNCSFLAVLKKLGKANDNLLSFPIEGYTLALDFKLTMSTIKMIHKLDNLIVGMGGRVYLTKDAVMQESTFKATYPKWEEFEHVRDKYKAIGKFSSMQSKRLGLA